MSIFSKVIGEITGSNTTKRRENDLNKATGEYQQGLYGQGDTLRALLAELQKAVAGQYQNARMGRTQAQGNYNNYLGGLRTQSANENDSLINRLLQQITGELDNSANSQRQAFQKYASADLGYAAPELEAFYGSRGMNTNSGAVSQALAKQILGIKGKEFDLEQNLANQRLGALSSIFGQQANNTREDLTFARQKEMDNFLKQLGFAREDETNIGNYKNQLNFSTPLDLEQSILQFQRGGAALPLNIAQQGAENARARQNSIESSLENGLASLISAGIGGYGLTGSSGNPYAGASTGSSNLDLGAYNDIFRNLR